MKNKNSRLLLLILLVIVIIITVFSINNEKKEKELVKINSIELPYVEEMQVNSRGIVLWDGDYLYYYNKKGEFDKKIDKSSENLKIFFVKDEALLYDSDLNKVYEYSAKGDLVKEIKSNFEIYNITENNGNLIFHLKSPEGEKLAAVTPSGDLEIFYETQNFILTYDVDSPGVNFILTELSTSAMGYNTTLYISDNKEIKKMDYQGEVALHCKLEGKNIFLLTEKSYYRITRDDVIQKEIPLISDVHIDKRNIYLLHSGIFSKYDLDLNEISKNIVAANVNKITEIGKEIFLYGQSDIAGNIGTDNEFYLRMDTRAEKIAIRDTNIITMKRDGIDIYKIDNKKADKKSEKPEQETSELENEKVVNWFI